MHQRGNAVLSNASAAEFRAKPENDDRDDSSSSRPSANAIPLPARGEIKLSAPPLLIAKIAGIAATAKLLISPLAGEMSGRTEGGAKGRKPLILSTAKSASFGRDTC